MSKGQWPFRQRDLTRAIKAAEKAGKVVLGITITKDGPRLAFEKAGISEEDAVGAWDNAVPIGGKRCYK